MAGLFSTKARVGNRDRELSAGCWMILMGNSFLGRLATLCRRTKLGAVSFSRGPLPTKNLPVHGSDSVVLPRPADAGAHARPGHVIVTRFDSCGGWLGLLLTCLVLKVARPPQQFPQKSHRLETQMSAGGKVFRPQSACGRINRRRCSGEIYSRFQSPEPPAKKARK